MNFEELYKSYWNRVFRLCLGYCNDYSQAQDLAQDVFVRVWKYLPTFKGESSVGTWIFRITTNVCLRYHDHQTVIKQIPIPDNILQDSSEQDSMPVQALYKAISTLPEMDRLTISLYLEETKESEIAQIIGISHANVRVRIHRIKSILAERMKHEE